MISKGSCDTEDWSNEAENSALPSETYLIVIKLQLNKLQLYLKIQ